MGKAGEDGMRARGIGGDEVVCGGEVVRGRAVDVIETRDRRDADETVRFL